MWKRVEGVVIGLVLVALVVLGRMWWLDHVLVHQIADVIAAAQENARQQQVARVPSPPPPATSAPAPSGGTP
jgi:hypothetical protein